MKVVRSLARGLVCVAALATGACAASPQYPVREGDAPGTGGLVPPTPRFQIAANSAPAPQAVAPAASPRAAAPVTATAPTPAPVPEPTPLPPVKPEPQPVPVPPPLRVTVRSGETIYDVAARNRAPVRGIIDANNLTPPYDLRAGQVLTVPRPATHVVQEGDTLFGVARRFMVDVHSLASLNDLTLQSRLRVGQPLALPSGAKDTGVTPPSPTPTLAAVSGEPAEPATTRPARPGPSYSSSSSSTASTGATSRPTYVPPPVSPSMSAEVSEATAAEAAAVGCGPAPVAARSRRSAHTVADAYAAVERSPTAIAPDSPAPPANEPPPVAQTPFETAAVESGGGRFVWPVKGPVISTFGPKPTLAQNDGIDIGAAFGTPVVATADGHVVFNGAVAGQGKTILLKHYDDNWASVYGQLSRSLVKNEEKVKKGQVIACIGQGQNFAQPQLHFELRYRAAPTEKHRPVNPLLILAPSDNR